jgi:type II restriction/modification system DNA methylase subunit YeeA
MLCAPNPDGRHNADVVKPWVNGLDITRRARGVWIVDFGTEMPIEAAALYEAPFEYVRREVMPTRRQNRRRAYADQWWLHAEARPGMRRALEGLSRFLVTPTLSKHRLFVWVEAGTLPDKQLVAFARDDDYFFGVLHSSVHELWARSPGTQLREVESGFRYTPTTTFETFPFPEASEDAKAEISEAAKTLDALRRGWLDPPGLDEQALRARTLTNLYNLRPTWVDQAHLRLDRAVHTAYGWPRILWIGMRSWQGSST